MRITIDGAGRIVVPQALRERLGLTKGAELEIAEYGGALFLTPLTPTGRLVRRPYGLVVEGEPGTVITDADVQALRDAGRR